MLTEEQKQFFDTFGYLVLRDVFTPDEMATIKRESDEIFSEGLGNTLPHGRVALQPFWHIDTGPVAEGVQKPPLWRIPTVVSPFSVPDWYMSLDPEGREGIIELPMDQQQDLMCVYQVFHQQKVYRTWAGAARRASVRQPVQGRAD